MNKLAHVITTSENLEQIKDFIKVQGLDFVIHEASEENFKYLTDIGFSKIMCYLNYIESQLEYTRKTLSKCFELSEACELTYDYDVDIDEKQDYVEEVIAKI